MTRLRLFSLDKGEAMNLHGQIMNLPIVAVAGQTASEVTAYKIGYRDARHAAAELAQKADARIAELECDLETAHLCIKQLEGAPASAGFDGWFKERVTTYCDCDSGMILCTTSRNGWCDGLSYDYDGQPDGACDDCNGARKLPCPECGSLRMVLFPEYETQLRAELEAARAGESAALERAAKLETALEELVLWMPDPELDNDDIQRGIVLKAKAALATERKKI